MQFYAKENNCKNFFRENFEKLKNFRKKILKIRKFSQKN